MGRERVHAGRHGEPEREDGEQEGGRLGFRTLVCDAREDQAQSGESCLTRDPPFSQYLSVFVSDAVQSECRRAPLLPYIRPRNPLASSFGHPSTHTAPLPLLHPRR